MKKVLFFFVAILFVTTSFAQVNEVKTTALGTGMDEEQATKQALRNAIEQTFGAFVSSNTTILNDRLVQDEIVSVSNGNIKDFKKLAVSHLSNGRVSVSLEATVSINKLISYAESKGSRAEFAGEAFSYEVKLMKLRAKETQNALNLMVQQLDMIAKQMFDFKLVLGDPCATPTWKKNYSDKSNYYFNSTIEVYGNEGSTDFANLLTNTLLSLKLSDNDVKLCRNLDLPMYDINYCSSLNEIFGTKYHEEVGLSQKYRHQDDCLLPISYEKWKSYKERIITILKKAFFRYSVVEIGNPQNKYSYREFSRDEKHSSMYVGVLWDYIYCPAASAAYNYYKINSDFCLTEVKKPIQLTKQQQKDLKKGKYTGPTYTISYENPKLIIKFQTDLPASRSSLDNGKFQGFELKY